MSNVSTDREAWHTAAASMTRLADRLRPTLSRFTLSRGDLGPNLATLAYTLRTMLAIGIALFTAFALQLQSPLSSVTTVLIVANPVTGALVSKSVWRLLATLLGAVAAVVLMAAFAQAPLLFTVALSLCIGLACMVASLLRYFRAYGAVLAGYTIIIVASGSFADPLNIFVGALSRVSAVSVGIVSAALVFLLTTLPTPPALGRTIEDLIRDIAQAFVVYRRPEGQALDTLKADRLPRTGLLTRAGALDEAIEYAGADSYVLRRRMGRLRLGAARLLGLLSMLEPLHELPMPNSPDAEAGRRAQGIARETMLSLSQLQRGRLASSLPAIEAAHAEVAALASGMRDPQALTLTLHERDLLEQLAQAIGDLTGAGPADTRMRLRAYLDWQTAIRNGVRGFLVTLIGGLFWYVTQWTAGPTMLSFLVPAACLLSSSPSASRASVEFATGTVLAIVGSALCQTFILPQISGFPLLWGALCLCLAPGIWLQFDPVHRNRAFAYVVFFNATVNIHNPITYDDISLFNNWLAVLLGSICLVMVFRVLLPADPARDVRRLSASLGRAVERLSRRGTNALPSWETWQNLQMQKAQRLVQRLQQVPDQSPAAIMQAAFVIVALGRVVLTLQRLKADPTLPSDGQGAARRALHALQRVRAAPERAASGLDALERAMLPQLDAPEAAGTEPAGPECGAMRVLVGTLGEAALLVRRGADLLDRRAPLLMAGR